MEASNQAQLDGAGWNLEATYQSLPKGLFEPTEPIPVKQPTLLLLNRAVAELLGLDAGVLETQDAIFAGNSLPPGSHPIAQAYGGHQFGQFNILGDGRAILLGEQVTPKGDRYDVQLKGSGRTLYSRRGDGRSAMGPMLREFILSEAMHALGVPTTRSLAVAATGEAVYRETPQPGAILTRVAASHIRVGTFQFAAAMSDYEALKALTAYTIHRHYPQASEAENPPLELLREVIAKQADLIAYWMSIGFIHGVMNTDNVSICGETIDYGPCAFLNAYDPGMVYSSIDHQGRYAYGNQPNIGHWNLVRFAEALLPLLAPAKEAAIDLAQNALEDFAEHFNSAYKKRMLAKIGIAAEQEGDFELVQQLLNLMQASEADFTHTFRALSEGRAVPLQLEATPEFQEWRIVWESRLGEDQTTALESMKQVNPWIIPRNRWVEEAIDAVVEKGDFEPLGHLLGALERPFEESEATREFRTKPYEEDDAYQTFCGT
jgi:uncharacterized protein YdiU (UPF0061 family)